MRLFIQNIARRYTHCEEGASAIIWALTLLPVMILMGFAIDISRVSSAERQLQSAVDSAVLASALDFAANAGLPETERLAQATEVFEEVYALDIRGALGGFSTVQFDVVSEGDGAIRADVTGNLPLAFGGLLGQTDIDLFAASSASAGPPQDLEIVLVLDNTVSMFRNNRVGLMRSAVKDFSNTLLDASSGPGSVAIGVVPWASTVNINSERPGGLDLSSAPNRSVPSAGSRRVPLPAFENRLQYLLEPEDEVDYTAQAMQEDFGLVGWRGCIRTAPDERIVSAAGNVGQRLTDDPVNGMRWHVNMAEAQLRATPFSGNTSSFSGDLEALTAGLNVAPNEILLCNPNVSGQFSNPYLDEDHACKNSSASTQINTLEACISDPNEFEYLNNGGNICPWRTNILPWNSIRSISGPNMNCPTSMLGLSEDREQIINKLDEMYLVPPGTQADIGLMWGLRMLSPRSEWADFFGQDRPTDYDAAGARKIMVLLTDGQNAFPNLVEGYYGCSVDSNNSRGESGPCWLPDSIGDPSNDSLDSLMLDSCDAIREDYNVELFTIAVDITDPRTINLLADCADDADRAFNISASEIDAVFESIAAQELVLLP